MPGCREASDRAGVAGSLLPIMTVVAFGFFVIGIALPVLPLHVHGGLGLDAFVVGLVSGSQFAVSIATRPWAGHHADHHGPRNAVVIGLLAASGSGVLYLLSLCLLSLPVVSATILLFGRAVLGGAESFIITGAVTWGLARLDAGSAGKVIAWVGTAMFAAMAAGAPVGTGLFASGGFAAVATVGTLMPLAALGVAMRMSPTRPQRSERPSLLRVVRAVWMPGVGAACSSVGFGAILAFGSLFFVDRGWGPVWLPFTAYAVALIATRLLLGHLPDRIGGAAIAFVFVFLEAAGLGLMWRAPGAVVATAGAALTGFGYSLVYPAFGVEAVRRAPSQSRGVGMGAYTVFLDVALGVGSPALGLVASSFSIATVFLVAAGVVLCSAIFARLLVREGRSATGAGG